MATYTGTLIVDLNGNNPNPTSYLIIGQFEQGANYFGTTIIEAIDLAIIDLIAVWNGSITYTITSVGAVDTYSFTWINAIVPDNVVGNPLALIIYWDNSLGQSSFCWIEDVTNTLCEDCEELTFSACETSYTIVAGLEIGTTYTIGITDRNGKVWKQDVVADGSGDVTVDTTEFPRGFFTPESGPKQLQVWTNADLTGAELITVGSIEYTCLVLSFQYVTDTTV